MSKISEFSEYITQFAKDIETEAKRITWPSRPEAVKSTLAVIVISGVFAGFLGLVDFLFSMGARFLLG
jgi:preprotein translocase SecE subunit